MFLYPEPAPIDYYLADVSPTFLADGIFYHGNPAPCHKYIGKYLRPIKRTLSHPPPPIEEIHPRRLNVLLAREKEEYVDPCGRDHGLVFETYRSMPKRKRDHSMAQKSLYSIFPRSPQYELWYIQDQRHRGILKHNVTTRERSRKEEKTKTDEEPCHLLRAPFWWQEHDGEPKKLPMGNINDYAFKKLKESQHDERKISERLAIDHPKKYMPGVIHRLTNPEDTSMKDTLEKADTFKVILKSDEALPEDGPPLIKCTPLLKRPCMEAPYDSKQSQQDADKTVFDNDRRWQPCHEEIGFSGRDLELQEELRKITKPFLHDLHIWYSKNKPTKLLIPIRRSGKRSIPGRRISHL